MVRHKICHPFTFTSSVCGGVLRRLDRFEDRGTLTGGVVMHDIMTEVRVRCLGATRRHHPISLSSFSGIKVLTGVRFTQSYLQ